LATAFDAASQGLGLVDTVMTEVFYTANMFSLLSYCEVDVLQSKIFASSFIGNSVEWPQIFMGSHNKQSV
jgi:hypothetical protein